MRKVDLFTHFYLRMETGNLGKHVFKFLFEAMGDGKNESWVVWK